MSRNKLTIICLLLAATLTVAGIAAAVSPTGARSLSCVTWNGAASPSDLSISSDYLVEGGQIVDVGYVTGTRTFAISVINGSDKNWTAQVVSSDTGNLTAALSDPVSVGSGEDIQSMTLTLTAAETPFIPTQASSEETDPAEESSSGTDESSSPEESSESSEQPESSSETSAESSDSSSEPTEPSTEAPRYPDTASAVVTLRCDSTVLSASFEMHFYDTVPAANGSSVSAISPYFGRYVPVRITGGANDTLLHFGSGDGRFPAGSAYTVDDHRTVLYGAGYIMCPAGKQMTIDLTDALESMDSAISITPGSGSAYTLSRLDVGGFPEDTPTVLTESYGKLPVKYKPQGIIPEFSLEKMLIVSGNASWEPVVDSSSAPAPGGGPSAEIFSEASDGYARFDVTGLEAGTYKLRLTWNDGSFDICSLERTVFVRHENAETGPPAAG